MADLERSAGLEVVSACSRQIVSQMAVVHTRVPEAQNFAGIDVVPRHHSCRAVENLHHSHHVVGGSWPVVVLQHHD